MKFVFSEPEPAIDQTDKIDSVTNQDGWLNALSLEKLTNTVNKKIQIRILDITKNLDSVLIFFF